MKIFISGPMAGKKDNNIVEFNNMESHLKQLGFDVYNPAWNFYGQDWDRQAMLAVDIMALSHCDGMVQLEGWRLASGCMAEYAFANACGMPLFSEKDIAEMRTKKHIIEEERLFRFSRRNKNGKC